MKEKEISMLTSTKVHDIEACELTLDDIEDILTSDQHGVCRAILSPEAAKLLLKSHNFKNRGLKKHQKAFLQRQIEAGKFVYNGETIIVGDNGQILNGQHRLAACVATGKAIEVLMVFGVPASAFVTVDQGARRGGADVLAIEGYRNCNNLAATLRQIDNYFKGALGKAHASGPSGAEGRGDNSFTLELLARYPDVEQSVSKMKGFRLSAPAVACALHYLFRQRSPEQADEFCDVLLNGFSPDTPYTEIGRAGGVLREWLTRAALGSKKTPPWVQANIWIKAWNAGRTDSMPKVLSWKDGIDKPLLIQ
jgi:hypothetical protein